jgi:agmatine deiminase
MFVVNGKGERRVVAPTFNGWGEKMDGMFHEDQMLKARLCKHLDLPMYPVDVCMEGGGIVLDGDGTLITNEQCMMHKTRNPGITKNVLEKRLNDAFGTTKVLWTGKGLEPDPITDGHVDGMMAYIDSGTLLLSATEDKSDPNFKICLDAKKRLQGVTDAKDRKIEIIDLPLTPEGGHMNFYIANDCVVVPTTGDRRQDNAPMAILKELFDDRDVIGISGRVLGDGGGGIHCITQQVPAV